MDSPRAFTVCCEKVKALRHHGGNIDNGVSGRAKMETIGSEARHILTVLPEGPATEHLKAEMGPYLQMFGYSQEMKNPSWLPEPLAT